MSKQTDWHLDEILRILCYTYGGQVRFAHHLSEKEKEEFWVSLRRTTEIVRPLRKQEKNRNEDYNKT